MRCGLIRSAEVRGGAHSVLRVEDVGGRRVVQDEGLPQVSAQPAQVLHVAALVEDAGLPEQTGPEHTALIQQVSHWVRILPKCPGWGGAGGGKHELTLKE